MLQLACKLKLPLATCECTGCQPEADMQFLFVCVCVSVCLSKASVHNVHKPIHTQCMRVNVYLTACMHTQTLWPIRGVSVLNITAANP